MQPTYWHNRQHPAQNYRRPYGYGYGRRPFYGGGNAFLGGLVGGLGGSLLAGPLLYGGYGGYGYGGYPPPGYGYGYPPYGGGYYY
ncbi:hypothetical protein [Bacillus sp. JCM 19041]|uniref:hypothetical protein n=1 Tax=Bacillus sp. JCM 19041 TaxID=1460637 RepID=UPI0006CF8FF9